MTGLQVADLSVVYQRSIVALEKVSLDVPPGQVVALLGANGAGKSTTLRAISGFLGGESARINSGSILYDGQELRRLRLPETMRRGIVLVPEREKVFLNLTVEQNLAVVVSGAAKAEHGRREEAVYAYFPRLAGLRRRTAGLLSGGERQMLAIGAALICAPKLMLIDELSLGLAPVIVDELLDRLRQVLAETGMSMLLVEQSAAVAFSIAGYGYVLENGRVELEGRSGDLKADPRIRELYLGGRADKHSYLDGAIRRKKERRNGCP